MTTCRLAWLLLAAAAAGGSTFYVASDGDDAADGRSPETAWRGLERVNTAELAPGDSVLFRCGDSFRGSLSPASGAEGQPITYGAWGEGAKPRLLGSASRSRPEDWRDEGGGLWSTGHRSERVVTLPAPDPAAVRPDWWIYTEGGAKAELTGAAATSWRLRCLAPGSASNHLQFIAPSLSLVAGTTYRFAARVRSSQAFGLTSPVLMDQQAPWTNYSGRALLVWPLPAGEWVTVVQHYRPRVTDDTARLTFALGGVLPANATLELADVSFAACPPTELPDETDQLNVDVGNIIFDGGPDCGWKRWSRDDLANEGDYWYDAEQALVWLRSAVNPAQRWSSLELALRRHIIDESGASWVTYEDLDLRYGAAHGIGGGSTHHIVARDLDISFIGGGNQTGPPRNVRFGNGIEFWGNAHDNLVERCRIWEVYDAALTNQSLGADVTHANLVYQNNLIWNCEYSFEYWNRPATSVTSNVRFLHNSCQRAGGGWGHAQRPDPGGRHLCFYSTDAPTEALVISNNIFAECTDNALYAPQLRPEQLAAIDLRHNLWWQPKGDLIWAVGQRWRQDQLADYQARFPLIAGAVLADPAYLDPAALDFHLAPDSPARGAGLDLSVGSDFTGQPRPAGPVDLGAYAR